MPYIDYNLSLYRTGFRPYDMTNPWSATQLNGYSTASAALSGYLGTGIRPFTDAGGQRLGSRFPSLGQHYPFGPWRLRGMGQAAVCLDQNQNSVPCSDPNCTYGDCGSTSAQVTIGALCLDQHENQIDCSNPECTYGDCVSPKRGIPTPGVALPPGPSPRTYAPQTLFPQTAPLTSYPISPLAATTSNTLLMGGLAILAIAMLMSGGKK